MITRKSYLWLVICLFVLGVDLKCVSAEDCPWEQIDGAHDGVNTVLFEPDSPHAVYMGSKNSVYKSIDGGANWRSIFSVGGGSNFVNLLTVEPEYKKTIYCLTSDGLYASCDHGARWRRLFRGKTATEKNCTALVRIGSCVFLGTDAGLFISQDEGRNWRKKEGEIGTVRISAISYNQKCPECIYITSNRGVYRSIDGGNNWERMYVSVMPGEGLTQDNESNDDSDGVGRGVAQYITVDPNNVDNIYLATTNGVYFSRDKAKSWSAMSDYGLLSNDVRYITINGESRLYVATMMGIFCYENERWHELSLRLSTRKINSLSINSARQVFAACENGLFKMDLSFVADADQLGRAVISDHEPEISLVQKAAIEYADVNLDKIKEWHKRAAKKAWLPQVSTGVNNDSGDLWHWETGSSAKNDDDTLRRGKSSIEWDVNLSWDFGDLVWNNDQTSIDSRSRLLVELREDVLDQVNKLYFERIRVKEELNSLKIEDGKRRFEKELKLRELTASLDGLTGGYFSSYARKEYSG